MINKFKNLRKPMLMAAAAFWIAYIFMAKGVGEGFMTVVMVVVALMFLNIE